MSFDPFETRLQFLQLLRKLNASQPSIQKVVSYAIKYGSRCGEDLWECITEESGKGSLNTRINILYFLDSLLEACQAISTSDAPYLRFIGRDLGDIVGKVVPNTREGVLNLKSARQILDTWRLRRLVEPHIIDEALQNLESRKHDPSSPKKRSHEETFSRSDILRRMEEDRERHKRLRERIWILPIPVLSTPISSKSKSRPNSRHPNAMTFQSPVSTSPATPASPSGPPSGLNKNRVVEGGRMRPPPVPPLPSLPRDLDEETAENGAVGAGGGKMGSALDVEFDVLWETGSELDEEDLGRMRDQARIRRIETNIR